MKSTISTTNMRENSKKEKSHIKKTDTKVPVLSAF